MNYFCVKTDQFGGNVCLSDQIIEKSYNFQN